MLTSMGSSAGMVRALSPKMVRKGSKTQISRCSFPEMEQSTIRCFTCLISHLLILNIGVTQSLRHAAGWTDQSEGRCQTKIFELPGCDHRGVSSDPRMLELLRGVLGLHDQKQQQDLEDHHNQIRDRAQERFGRIEHWICCALVAKAGSQSLNVLRRRFAIIIVVMAILSFGICVFISLYESSNDYGLNKSMAWGSGGTTDNEWEFDLGVNTYAYITSLRIGGDGQGGKGGTGSSTGSRGNRSNSNNDTERNECLYSYAGCISFYDEYGVAGFSQYGTVLDPRVLAKCADPPEYPCDNLIGPGCNIGLKLPMCQACHDASILTSVVLLVTTLIQIPLVWLSCIRISASSDKRWRKWLILPLTLAVVFGTILVHISWRTDCFGQLEQLLEDNMADNPYGRVPVTSVHLPSYMILVAGFLAFSAFILNMLTPVPELYQSTWLDPEVIPILENSGTMKASSGECCESSYLDKSELRLI